MLKCSSRTGSNDSFLFSRSFPSIETCHTRSLSALLGGPNCYDQLSLILVSVSTVALFARRKGERGKGKAGGALGIQGHGKVGSSKEVVQTRNLRLIVRGKWKRGDVASNSA